MKINGFFLFLTHVGVGMAGFFAAANMDERNYDTMIAYFGWGWIAFATVTGLMFSALIINRHRAMTEEERAVHGPPAPSPYPPAFHGGYGPAPMPMGNGQFPVVEGEFRRAGNSSSYGVSGGGEFK